MCGIVGFFGVDDAVSMVIDGLEKLEYRGYDSAGIAYKTTNQFNIVKDKGRVLALQSKLEEHSFSDLAIGHTRWATHGEPNAINAHPHKSLNNRFIIVHNGIIENYQSLKFEYLKEYEFLSETDTEIMVDLIEHFSLELSVSDAIRKTMSVIEGSYACLVLDTEDFDHIYFFKNESPLLLGKSKNGIGFASDLTGLIGKMDEYMVLEDKTVGIASRDDFKIFDMVGFSKEIRL
ncbi:MAG: class II glutamine amidotransferase, partial [Anaeroplasmataceae bacterium]|nr:class II glutamine amidotransferase [Anaeroplasmataceae bacterium]